MRLRRLSILSGVAAATFLQTACSHPGGGVRESCLPIPEQNAWACAERDAKPGEGKYIRPQQMMKDYAAFPLDEVRHCIVQESK